MILPIGFGVTGKGGKFYGTLATGISLEKLKEQLENSMARLSANYAFTYPTNVRYLILDYTGKVILHYNKITLS